MIGIRVLKEYAEELERDVKNINSARLVCMDKDMSDALRQMKTTEFPALFVVIPSSDDNSNYPDNISERSQCLFFLLDRADNQRRKPLAVLEETQQIAETLKAHFRDDACKPCHFMSGMRGMSTNPETGLYTDYCGWSISFSVND